MRIQNLDGGLANQVFQYIFYRYAQMEHGDRHVWFLDDSFFFFRPEHNGYELGKVFGLQPNLLSSHFEPDVWNYFVENCKKGIGIPQTMLGMGFQIEMVSEAANYKKDNPFLGTVYTLPCNLYLPGILDLPGKVLYYFGYWINKEWMNKYKNVLMEELAFPEITDEKNAAYANQIRNTSSCGIHIRRGDFVSLGYALSADFYKSAVKDVINARPGSVFYVFSDDIPYVKDHEAEFGLDCKNEVIYVEGNKEDNNYKDLQLLSMCKALIMSNSSFCYLAALLDQGLEYYINPVSYRQI